MEADEEEPEEDGGDNEEDADEDDIEADRKPRRAYKKAPDANITTSATTLRNLPKRRLLDGINVLSDTKLDGTLTANLDNKTTLPRLLKGPARLGSLADRHASGTPQQSAHRN